MDKKTYFWLMLGLAILTIMCWVITVCAPSLLWTIMNFVLWFSLILSWVSAIINAIKNRWVQYIGILLAIWVLWLIFGIMLICWRAGNFVWKLTMWLFALWALMRWCILAFNWIQNKNVQKWWILEVVVWWLLLVLAILTAFNTWEAARFAWVCIGISIIFDWIALCIFAFKIKNADSIQAQIITQSSQNEIGQWEVIIQETVTLVKEDERQ